MVVRMGRAATGERTMKLMALEPDPVIEAYKADIDRTLIRENLKLTVDERLLKMMDFNRLLLEVRKAGQRGVSGDKGSDPFSSPSSPSPLRAPPSPL